MKNYYHKIYSSNLGHDFEFKSFGHGGKPIMVFPTSCGKFHDYEGQGMIDTVSHFIENGEITLFCVDSRDSDCWFKEPKDHWMGINHLSYEKCITEEVIPFIHNEYSISKKFITTGNSWGGYHCINFALKFPHLIDGTISLSGAYSPSMAIGDYYDESVYYNDILKYLPNLNDENILSELKKSHLIICHGKGNFEQCAHDAWELAQMLGTKSIPHTYSVWSENYPHDWGAWKKQLPFFVDELKQKNFI